MAGIVHYGLGFAAKKFAPKLPVGVLLVAGGALDLIAIPISLLGFQAAGEAPYWTHGLVMAAIWAILAAAITAIACREFRSSLVVGLLVFSHWIVDFITWPMSGVFEKTSGVPFFFSPTPNFGLGLFSSLAVALVVEFVSFFGGLAIYLLWLRAFRKRKAGA